MALGARVVMAHDRLDHASYIHIDIHIDIDIDIDIDRIWRMDHRCT